MQCSRLHGKQAITDVGRAPQVALGLEPQNDDDSDPPGWCLLENKGLVLRFLLRLCIFA